MTVGCVSAISPSWALLERIPTGDPMTTNVRFGGPDLRTACAALSGESALREAADVASRTQAEPGGSIGCRSARSGIPTGVELGLRSEGEISRICMILQSEEWSPGLAPIGDLRARQSTHWRTSSCTTHVAARVELPPASRTARCRDGVGPQRYSGNPARRSPLTIRSITPERWNGL